MMKLHHQCEVKVAGMRGKEMGIGAQNSILLEVDLTLLSSTWSGIRNLIYSFPDILSEQAQGEAAHSLFSNRTFYIKMFSLAYW